MIDETIYNKCIGDDSVDAKGNNPCNCPTSGSHCVTDKCGCHNPLRVFGIKYEIVGKPVYKGVAIVQAENLCKAENVFIQDSKFNGFREYIKIDCIEEIYPNASPCILLEDSASVIDSRQLNSYPWVTKEDFQKEITEIYKNPTKIFVEETTQIQSDWNQTNTNSVDYIKNKPTDLVHTRQTQGLIRNDGTIDTTSYIDGVAQGDSFLNSANNKIGSAISIIYNSDNQHLELKGNNNAVVSYVDMAEFVRDGMLDNVEYYSVAEQGVTIGVPYMKYTFNTAYGQSVIRISLADLYNIYDGSNINLTSAFAEALTYSAPQQGDSFDVVTGKLLKGHNDNVTAIASKQNVITGAATTITSDNLTPNKVAISNSSGKVDASDVTTTELGYLSGATSNIQQQIDLISGDYLEQVQDLDNFQASEGKIAQYIGETNSKYTNGYIYKKTGTQIIIPSGTDYIEILNRWTENSIVDKCGISVGLYYKTDKTDNISSNIYKCTKWSFSSGSGGINVYQEGNNYKVRDNAIGTWWISGSENRYQFRTVSSVSYSTYQGVSYPSRVLLEQMGGELSANVGVPIVMELYQPSEITIFENINGQKIYCRQENGVYILLPLDYDGEHYQVITDASLNPKYYTNGVTQESITIDTTEWIQLDVQPREDTSHYVTDTEIGWIEH